MRRVVKPYKTGFRALGLAERFARNERLSVLAGVVQRRDLVVDGVYFTGLTVGGLDATEKIVSLVRESGRRDVNVILTNGCIVSWFNIIDIERVYRDTGVPVICVSYEESEGLEKYIREYFPGDEERLSLYRRLGPREKMYLRRAGRYLYVRYAGLEREEARSVLEAFSLGGVPEPLRVAQAVARAAYEFFRGACPVMFRQPNNTVRGES